MVLAGWHGLPILPSVMFGVINFALWMGLVAGTSNPTAQPTVMPTIGCFPGTYSTGGTCAFSPNGEIASLDIDTL